MRVPRACASIFSSLITLPFKLAGVGSYDLPIWVLETLGLVRLSLHPYLCLQSFTTLEFAGMETKNCLNCGPLPIENFSFRNKAKGLRASLCKPCHSTYRTQHYQNNRAKYIAKAKRNIIVQRERNYKLKEQYLLQHPCTRCSESDSVVLEFHHRNRIDKEDAISKMIGNGYSWRTILREIAKCDVLCCNCHRKQTAIDLGWRKTR